MAHRRASPRCLTGSAAVALLALAAIAVLPGPLTARAEEVLLFTPPDGWVGRTSPADSGTGYAVTQFIPREQTTHEQWTDLLIVENYARWRAPATNAFSMMHYLKTYMQSRCGTSTFWSILDQRGNTILYEWATSNCRKNEPDQHAIARILWGASDVWIVTYRGRVKPLGRLPAQTRDAWIRWLDAIDILVR